MRALRKLSSTYRAKGSHSGRPATQNQKQLRSRRSQRKERWQVWGAYSAYYSSEEYIYRTCTRTFATVPPRAESKPPPAVQQVNDVGTQ